MCAKRIKRLAHKTYKKSNNNTTTQFASINYRTGQLNDPHFIGNATKRGYSGSRVVVRVGQHLIASQTEGEERAGK